MSFFHVIGFALKAGHLLLMLCGWIASVISMNWFINGGTMDTKTDMLGDGRKLWLRLWDKISGRITYKVHHLYYQYISSNRLRKNWWRNLLVIWVVIGTLFSLWVFWYMNSQAMEKRKDTLASMCDERARMLQDQFNVSMNHVQAMSILISTFHHGKNPSAIDQRTFARYTERTAFERPLTSGVAYAVRVLHSEREHFEKQQGWLIKRMDTPEQIPVHKDEYDSYDLEVPEPSPIQPIQEEYAPVIFVQDTVAHVVSIDMLSGKVHSLEDGPAHSVWRTIGVTVNIIQSTEKMKIIVDCLNYDGIIVNSLEARGVISCLSQEPFKSVPLIWTIHERTLATRLTIHVKWPD